LGSSILVDFLLGPYNPAAWGPFVSAVLLAVWHKKGTGLLGLLKRGVEVRFSKRWWIPTFLLCPLMIGGAFLISLLAGNSVPELNWIADPFLLVSSFFVILVTGGPLQEEFGWRGYALPRLQVRFNALYSSLILGFMWGLWHLPYLFIGTEITYAYGISANLYSDNAFDTTHLVVQQYAR
jgi:membrane protease YdiL (CAAX protease family)